MDVVSTHEFVPLLTITYWQASPHFLTVPCAAVPPSEDPASAHLHCITVECGWQVYAPVYPCIEHVQPQCSICMQNIHASEDKTRLLSEQACCKVRTLFMTEMYTWLEGTVLEKHQVRHQYKADSTLLVVWGAVLAWFGLHRITTRMKESSISQPFNQSFPAVFCKALYEAAVPVDSNSSGSTSKISSGTAYINVCHWGRVS